MSHVNDQIQDVKNKLKTLKEDLKKRYREARDYQGDVELFRFLAYALKILEPFKWPILIIIVASALRSGFGESNIFEKGSGLRVNRYGNRELSGFGIWMEVVMGYVIGACKLWILFIVLKKWQKKTTLFK